MESKVGEIVELNNRKCKYTGNSIISVMEEESVKFNLNFKNLFINSQKTFSETEIVYRNKRRMTYNTFFNRVKGLAAGLESIGVKRGDTVAVIDWDTDKYLEAYFAVPMMGAILHTVNIRYSPELIYYTMNHAEDKYVIIRDEFIPILEKNRQMFDFIKGWIFYSDDGGIKTALSPEYNYEDLILREKYELPDVDENSTATIFYTSGTTGFPKGVTFTHRNLVLHTLALYNGIHLAPLEIRRNDNFMMLVPMFHVHSWGLPYAALLNGHKYVLPGKYEVGSILELIRKEEVKFSAMVPSILYMILSYPNLSEYKNDLNGWRIVIGGGALPKGLAMMARSFGITTIGGYGLSETAPVLSVALYNDSVKNLPDDQRFDYSISTGIPIPFVNLRVVDEVMHDVPEDGKSIGEIVVRAPWLTSGYFKDPEKTRALWKGGWMHTGDLAVKYPNGYITIVDREKDVVKSGGEFIPTVILENVLSEMKGLGETAVVGKPDEKWGERPVAFILGKPTKTKEEILLHLQKYVDVGRIQKWWIPDEFIFVDTFPRTSTGKADKKELRKMIGKPQGS
jgi:fatty-acyl-CoA synthase